MGIRPLLPRYRFDQGILRLDLDENVETELARVINVETQPGDAVKIDAMANLRLTPETDADDITYRIRLRLYRDDLPLVQGDVAKTFELGDEVIPIRELPNLTWSDEPGDGEHDYVLEVIVEDLDNIAQVRVFEVALNVIVFPFA